MVGWFLFMPVVGYGGSDGVATYGEVMQHLLYMVSHANVWHLAGNLFVLWIWRGRLHVVPSLLTAFVCSWFPSLPGVWEVFSAGEPLSTVTVGFSGVLFAMAGIRWGEYCRLTPFRRSAIEAFCMKALPFALLGMVIPHVNWCIHLYCIVAGFGYGYVLTGPLGEPAGTRKGQRENTLEVHGGWKVHGGRKEPAGEPQGTRKGQRENTLGVHGGRKGPAGTRKGEKVKDGGRK